MGRLSRLFGALGPERTDANPTARVWFASGRDFEFQCSYDDFLRHLQGAHSKKELLSFYDDLDYRHIVNPATVEHVRDVWK